MLMHMALLLVWILVTLLGPIAVVYCLGCCTLGGADAAQRLARERRMWRAGLAEFRSALSGCGCYAPPVVVVETYRALWYGILMARWLPIRPDDNLALTYGVGTPGGIEPERLAARIAARCGIALEWSDHAAAPPDTVRDLIRLLADAARQARHSDRARLLRPIGASAALVRPVLPATNHGQLPRPVQAPHDIAA